LYRAVWLLIALLVVIWLGRELPGPEVSLPSHVDLSWRRTSDGWEKLKHLTPPPYPHHPALHPGVIAAAQLLASLLTLVACSPKEGDRG
jgi:hypothetical protein